MISITKISRIAFLVLLLNTTVFLVSKAANIPVATWAANPSNYSSTDDVSDTGSDVTFNANVNSDVEINDLTLSDWGPATNTTFNILATGSHDVTINKLSIAGDAFNLVIKSGVTLIVNSTTQSNGGTILVEGGGAIIFKDDVTFAGDGITLTIEENGSIDVETELKITGGVNKLNVFGDLVANKLTATGGAQELKIGDNGSVKVLNDAKFSGSATFSVENDGDFRVGGDLAMNGGSSGSVSDNASLMVGGTISGGNLISTSGNGSVEDGLTSSVALPIELISFTAKANNNNVELNWATATEENNDYFTIERSTDGISFEVIATILGAGNSSTTINYSYTDYYPLCGISYYRIKQTDFDGKYSYTPTVSINWGSNVGTTKTQISSYPNPYKGGSNLVLKTANIEAGINMLINITTISGKSIYTTNATNTVNQEINLLPTAINNLSQGMYIISVSAGNSISQTKLMVE